MKLTSGTLAKYNEGIIANNRSWSVRLKYYKDGTWYALATSKTASLTMSDYTIDGKNITMGSVVGGKLEIKVKSIGGTEFENGTKVKFELKLDSSSVTLTSKPYVVDEMNLLKKANGTYDGTITAYDITYLMTKTYMPTANELFANEIVEAIANKYDLGIDDSVYDAIYAIDGDDWTAYTIIPDFTDKQTLGYMAGCYGCYAYVNEDENIAFGWYTDSGKSIAKNDVYEDGATVSEASPRTYKMIESGTKETPLVYPSQAIGHSINFENPYITALQVEAIYNTKVANDKVTFSVAKVKYRGDPLNGGAGSILKARQANGQITMFVMKRTLYYDGGVYEVIESLGESESTISYKVASPTQQRIDRALSRMEEAIKNATDIITQTKGSVFEFIPIDENDPSKGNSGWKLYSTQIGNNNLILANSSGIGFSNDGGETFGAAAIYIDENGVGHINGNYITAGSISADKIDTSQLVVGDNVSPDLETLLNGIVDKANNSVTNVDVLYGKNQSTTIPPTNWSTSAPVWEEGYYIWTKTQTTAGGEITETEPVCITGAKGETGASGEAGATGDTGQGVSAIEEQYYLSTSNSTQSGGSWSANQPEWSSGKYIWTRSKITWVNPSAITYTTPVLAKAINGANEKANNAETKADATELILGGLTAKENNVVYIKGSSILAGSIGADQIGANAITANKIAAGAITADKLTVGDMTNYNRVNSSSYAEWGFTQSGGWFVPDTASQYNYLSDWITYQEGLSYRFTGKVRSNAVYQNSYMEFTVGFRIKTTSGAYYASLPSDNIFTANQNKTERNFDFTWMPQIANVAEIRMAIINLRLVEGIYYTASPTAGTTDISNVTIRSVGNDAGNITAGKLQSADGNTFFDLDNDFIQSATSTHLTQIAEGVVSVADSTNGTRLVLGYDSSYKVGGLLFSEDHGCLIAEVDSNNKVTNEGLVARFTSSGIDLYKNLRINGKNVTPAILDWGTYIGATSPTTISFNNTFSSPPVVIATPLQSSASSYFVNVDVTSVTKTGFTVYFESGRQSDLMWIAISQ